MRVCRERGIRSVYSVHELGIMETYKFEVCRYGIVADM